MSFLFRDKLIKLLDNNKGLYIKICAMNDDVAKVYFVMEEVVAMNHIPIPKDFVLINTSTHSCLDACEDNMYWYIARCYTYALLEQNGHVMVANVELKPMTMTSLCAREERVVQEELVQIIISRE